MDNYLLATLGQFFLGACYCIAGVRNLQNIDRRVEIIAARGVPHARVIAQTGIGVMIVAGASLAVGVAQAAAALTLIVFTLVATVIYVWDRSDRSFRMDSVLTNTGLLGGLFLAFAAA